MSTPIADTVRRGSMSFLCLQPLHCTLFFIKITFFIYTQDGGKKVNVSWVFTMWTRTEVRHMKLASLSHYLGAKYYVL